MRENLAQNYQNTWATCENINEIKIVKRTLYIQVCSALDLGKSLKTWDQVTKLHKLYTQEENQILRAMYVYFMHVIQVYM